MNIRHLFLILLTLPMGLLGFDKQDINWNWHIIDTSKVSFPKDFLWGAATSAHQVEGNCTNNQWSAWETERNPDGTYKNVEVPAGNACDHWNRYKEDIKLLKKLGLNSYRFSVEWSKIEPKPGYFDKAALQHYKDVCSELRAQGIQPVITLYHYTHPLWFDDLDAFGKQENIPYFVNFCTKVFTTLQEYNPLWITFNSPTSYAFRGYWSHEGPPGKHDMNFVGQVLKNELEAHVQVYQALKKLPGGATARIGILHNMYQIDPWNRWNPFDILYAKIANDTQNKAFYGFFKDGNFDFWAPGQAHVTHMNDKAPQSLDFIGLNYYGHGYAKNFSIIKNPDEISADHNRYTIYGEGLYRAIKELSENISQPLNIPIYVTENGITTQNETHRLLFMQRYLFALSEALKDGYNVQGYIYWSLLDNWSWGKFTHYGLYPCNHTTQERGPARNHALYLQKIIERVPTSTRYNQVTAMQYQLNRKTNKDSNEL